MPPQVDRPYLASTFLLELAGVNPGLLQSLEGGSAVGEVVEEAAGPDHIQHKHIAGVKYEDIALGIEGAMAKEFYEFVKSIFDRKQIRKDFAIKRIGMNQDIVSEMDVFHGLVTEVAFPELNAASKEAGKLTVKISPEYTRMKAGSGKVSRIVSGKAKRWICSNFRLTIPGLDCTHVSKIGPLIVRAGVLAQAVAEHLDYEKESGNLQVPNLVVSLAEHTAQSFTDWHKSFVIDGLNSHDKEKDGTLEILAADLQEVLFTLKFHGLGIFRLASDKYDAGDERIHSVTAEMYCESIEFAYGPGVVAG